MIKYEISPEYEKLFKEFLLNIESYFEDTLQSIHKARNELKVVSFSDVDTVVKAFKVPHIVNKIVYTFFRDTKAKKSYRYSLKIGEFTPEPIGYIEFYKFGLLDKSYFISEKFDYDFTIREPLLDDSFENKDNILKAFARFTFKLHQNNIFHDDYSPGNILIQQNDDEYIFKIVDINRMKFYELSLEDRARNFSKLWAGDDELEIIAREYGKSYDCDKQLFVDRVCYYSNKNKQIKNLKKRLKGQKVVD